MFSVIHQFVQLCYSMVFENDCRGCVTMYFITRDSRWKHLNGHYRDQLGMDDKPDGEFYMSFQDFKK